MRQIFREKAVERLSSPDQIDQIMRVTSPLGWVALLTTGLLLLGAVLWGFLGSVPVEVQGQGLLLRPGGLRPVVSTTGGQVMQLLVSRGETLAEGVPVARLRVPSPGGSSDEGAEFSVICPFGGTVAELPVRIGEFVPAGTPLVQLTIAEDELDCILFMSLREATKVHPGMTVHVSPTNVDHSRFGYLLGRVRWVSPYAVSREEMEGVLGDPDLVELFAQGAETAPVQIEVELQRRLSSPSGYRWTGRRGPPFRILPGTMCSAQIVTEQRKPAELVLPTLERFLDAEPEGR